MKKTILIAEDDRAILEVVKIILESEGYDTLAVDSEEAMNGLFEKDFPDLVLLDIWLSGEDGGKIAKSLKANEPTSHIPVIIMSANNETEKIAKESGADDFLLKPFNLDDLLLVVKKYIN